MTNKPKALGTQAETGVLRAVINYFPTARREVLHGSLDHGDITGCGDFVFEVKGGAAAKAQAPGAIDSWMREARIEAENHGVQYGVLVTQRTGFSADRAHRWWVHLDLAVFAELVGGYYFTEDIIPVRLELGVFLQMLADRGHIADTAIPA